jgi:hypothetical protein
MKKHLWYLGGILLLSLTLRLYQLNWDQGFHLHPDERAIILFTIPLHLPLTLSQFFSAQSPLNPHFFAYGSLPLYLLFGLSNLVSLFFADATSYMYSNLLGRGISSVSDTITVALLFFYWETIRKSESRTCGIPSLYPQRSSYPKCSFLFR